jgi:hypothetical protein
MKVAHGRLADLRSTSALLGVLALAAFATAACASGTSGTYAASHPPSGPATVYVALGGDDSGGSSVSDPEHQDWPQLFYLRALSRRSTFYDLALPQGTSVEDLTGGEVSEALSLHPELVTVWVGLTDLLDGMSPATFRTELRGVLTELGSRGARLLVANLLPVWRFPAYSSCESQPFSCGYAATIPPPSTVERLESAYDDAIEVDAMQVHAHMVDVAREFSGSLDYSAKSGSNGSASSGSTSSGPVVDSTDLGLTPAGEQLVADAFETAYSAER